MIQPHQKDAVLCYLVENSSLGAIETLPRTIELEGFTDDALSMFFKEFTERGFIQNFSTFSSFNYKVTLSAHDFLRRGGFMGEEILFQDKIEKLYTELEKLQRDDSESIPQKTKMTITETIQLVASLIESYKALTL